MFEDVAILFEFIFKEIPDYPHRIAMSLRGIESADTHNLFELVWIPFNLYLLIRIFQPSLRNEQEPSRLAYCIGAFFVCLVWTLIHISQGHDSPLKYVREMHILFLAIKLFTVYVNSLLLLKTSFLIIQLYRMAFNMYRVDSVLHLIFKDANLKLILTTKSMMRYLVVYMLLSALSQYVSPNEVLVIDLFFIWGFATIPLLIVCFFIAKQALHKRHQSVFIEVIADQQCMLTGQGLEETLSMVASKRMGTDLIINDIFMGQIFKLVLAAILTYSVNHFLV